MFKTICGKILKLLFVFFISLIILVGCEAIEFGINSPQSECDNPFFVVVTGIIMLSSILFLAILIPDLLNGDYAFVEEAKTITYVHMMLVWFSYKIVRFSENNPNCDLKKVSMYMGITLLAMFLYTILYIILNIMECVRTYQKEDQSALEEPLVDDSKV